MKIKFFGVRGSLPACGPEYQRFGGNTTCLMVYRETANRIVIIDAGTGIRNLGKKLMLEQHKQETINILFTHFHSDHIQGFPFFGPAYNPDQKIGIMVLGKQREIKDIKEIFTTPLQSEYFPVQLEAMGARFNFITLGDRETYYGAQVTIAPQHHKFPGGSYGLRIEDESGSLVVCTDIEHIEGIDESIVKLASNADLLIHDGQYTEEEYRQHKGWGHSSWRHAVEVAKQAQVKKLVITHHDPDHDDDFLEAMEKECQAHFPNSVFAREGMELNI